jgi:putative ABC transport system ATP-binding protein
MIFLENITKVFNKGKANQVTALHSVSLQIAQGEFVVLVGSNGSGKSTLLNIVAGSETPSGGSVVINGVTVTTKPDYKRSKWLARVFQNPFNGTAPDLSVLDNFRLAALRAQTKKLSIGINGAFKQKVQEKIEPLGMGLQDKLGQPMGSLSGGQRQALTLLMSVMDETKVLLLDEPTAALDPKSAQTVLALADDLIKQYNLTALLVTHNLKDAHQYGNRLLQMHEGRVLRDLPYAEKQNLPITGLFEWFA